MENIPGSIIIMAYPDTFVRPSNEHICKITPYLGIGTKDAVKAGHAALCLINHQTGEVLYYDFGRYITPDGSGRVRSHVTDEELVVPIKATIEDGQVKNLEEILLWLEAHPEKTHGDGKLVASINNNISYTDADLFITALHKKGSIPYGIFVKQGSNCARFVADTLIAGVTQAEILKAISSEQILTPSPLGLVHKGKTQRHFYIVEDGKIKQEEKLSRKDNLKGFFEKKKTQGGQKTCTIPGAQQLEGIGSSASFMIEKTNTENEYRIHRYNEKGDVDCANIFKPTEAGFDISAKYQFVYDSNCDHCHIQQNGITYRFNKKT